MEITEQNDGVVINGDGVTGRNYFLHRSVPHSTVHSLMVCVNNIITDGNIIILNCCRIIKFYKRESVREQNEDK